MEHVGGKSEDPHRQVELFMHRKGVNGKIILAMVTGSQAYNLANEHSDYDFLGVGCPSFFSEWRWC